MARTPAFTSRHAVFQCQARAENAARVADVAVAVAGQKPSLVKLAAPICRSREAAL